MLKNSVIVFLLFIILITSAENNINSQIPDIISNFLPLSDNIKNQECKKHSYQLLEAFTNFETWALKMIDSSAKLQSGLLFGNIKNFGFYDECIGSSNENFDGKYCLANYEIKPNHGSKYYEETNRILDYVTLGRRYKEYTLTKYNSSLKTVPDLLPSFALAQIGICVPSSCQAEDVIIALTEGIEKIIKPIGLSVTVEIPKNACRVLKEPPLTISEYTVLAVCLAFVLLVICSSIYYLTLKDRYGPKTNTRKVLLSFSLPSNWNRLTTTDISPNGSFSSLEGIRVLSTFWVVMTHKLIAYSQEPWLNKAQLIECLPQLTKMPLVNTMLNVDTFLLVSGMLKAFHFIQELEDKKFNFFSCYSRRYLRLTPAYALMIAIYATFLPRFGQGPASYKMVTEPAEICQENWIYNLLYINNYVNNDKQCMIQSWYLAADMQLCLLSPLIIYPLWKWARFGKIIFSLAMTIAVIIPFGVIYLGNELATYEVMASDYNLLSYLKNLYFTTHARMSPYLIGLGLGYIFYRLKTTKVKLSKITIASGWALCMAVLYAVVFGAYDIMQSSHDYDPTEQALYGAFHRPAWAIAVSWIIFASHMGYGGYINDFLSAKIFQPLSKLSYCVFLTHYVILMIGTGRVRTALFVDEYILLHDFLGDIALTFILSLILYLFVEAPLFEITKIIYRRGPQAIKPPKNKEVEPVTTIKITETNSEDPIRNNV